MTESSFDTLVSEAKKRIQRQWPAMMLVEKPFELRVAEESTKPLHVILAQDFEAGVQFLSVVAERFGEFGEHLALAGSIGELLKVGDGLIVEVGSAFDPYKQRASSRAMATSPRLFVFSDRLSTSVEALRAAFAATSFTPLVRDRVYWDAHDESRPPDLFICHDSADKDGFVRPLAQELSKRLVKTWYDEHSLRPGDSLVEGIERGLQEARYALLVLSRSFLSNRRWAAREFRSLVTRDIADERRLIVPLWLAVERSDVAEYSLDLSDRVAIVVGDTPDVTQLADQLIRTLRLCLPDLAARR